MHIVYNGHCSIGNLMPLVCDSGFSIGNIMPLVYCGHIPHASSLLWLINLA